jgi:RNA polymerase-binding transcription factor DksA
MKKVRKPRYCSRCGEEIAADELASLPSTTCALCCNMQLEAAQIHQEKRHAAPAGLPLLHLAIIRPQ